jgi:CcmD family protein
MRQENATAPAAPSASTTPEDRSTSFQPVEGGPQQHNGATLMVEAYAVIWTILMVWLVMLWRKQAALSGRLDGLEQAIDRAAAKQQKGK